MVNEKYEVLVIRKKKKIKVLLPGIKRKNIVVVTNIEEHFTTFVIKLKKFPDYYYGKDIRIVLEPVKVKKVKLKNGILNITLLYD